jgi:hypothetical protein
MVERQPHGTANRESVRIARNATAGEETGGMHDGRFNGKLAHSLISWIRGKREKWNSGLVAVG